MYNIVNGNRNNIKLILDNTKYYDFRLVPHSSNLSEDLSKDNCKQIITFDFNNFDLNNNLYIISKDNVFWEKSFSNGKVLENIGYTLIDNGVIKFDRKNIKNIDFLKIFFNSQLTLPKDDKRLYLFKIDGNTKQYDYTLDLIADENNIYSYKFNGGFFQGFWKQEENYQILPFNHCKDYSFEFKLKPSDLINKETTINDKHPDNKGIFFYLGVRSENKWIDYLNNDFINKEKEKLYKFSTEDYLQPTQDIDLVNSKLLSYDIFSIKQDFCNCCCNNNVDELNKQTNKNLYNNNEDVFINHKTPFKLKSGKNINASNEVILKNDNLFLHFDGTKEGENVCTWDKNKEHYVSYSKTPNLENLFLLFNGTKEGENVCTYNSLIERENAKYNILKDLYNNAFCLQIKDDGSLGYKYLIFDCNTKPYKIESEFTKPNTIKKEEWADITIKIKHNKKFPTKDMTIEFYVNNKLKLISKKLPCFKFRALDVLNEKQETIPYNISLGGGTLGLLETISLNYMKNNELVLPIEKHFCGSFIGYIQNFSINLC